SAISKVGEKFRGGRVEITPRHGWIGLSFPLQKSLDIPAIFFHQRLRAILRMALEVYEQALLLLRHERIHSTLGRLRQHSVAARSQLIRPHFIPPGVRKSHSIPGTAGKHMVGSLREIKNSELFITQRMAPDSVAVQNPRVGSQT